MMLTSSTANLDKLVASQRIAKSLLQSNAPQFLSDLLSPRYGVTQLRCEKKFASPKRHAMNQSTQALPSGRIKLHNMHEVSKIINEGKQTERKWLNN